LGQQIDEQQMRRSTSGPTRSVRPMIPVEIADLTPDFFADAFQLDVSDAQLVDRSEGTTEVD
jgi:hypothetical protein